MAQPALKDLLIDAKNLDSFIKKMLNYLFGNGLAKEIKI
jgi:hypothetical protein